METSHADKRKDRRVTYIVNCMIRRDNEPGFKQYNTHNVSHGGMFIKTAEPFTLKTEIWFKLLNTEGHLLFTGKGMVMWRHVVKNPQKNTSNARNWY